jgi:hypothetical protein
MVHILKGKKQGILKILNYTVGTTFLKYQIIYDLGVHVIQSYDKVN